MTCPSDAAVTKRCGICKGTFIADCFHKRSASKDGLSACCKDCQKRYDQERLDKPDRILARAKYSKTEQGRSRLRNASAAWTERNRVKRVAHIIVGNALRDGKLIRQPCVCGNPKTEAHHDDYTKPFDVRWLCSPCHKAHHKIDRRLQQMKQAA